MFSRLLPSACILLLSSCVTDLTTAPWQAGQPVKTENSSQQLTCPVLPMWSPEIIPTLYDDFERSDRAGLGTPQIGGAWTLYGPGSTGAAGITSGRFTGGSPIAGSLGNLVYAASILTTVPRYFGAQFNFVTTSNSGGTDGAIAIVSSSDPALTTTIWQNMLHMVVWQAGWSLTLYRNGVPRTLAGGTSYQPLNLIADGRTYALWMIVDGDNVQMYLPDGTVAQACDPEVSDVHGNQVFYEHVYNNQSVHYGRFDLVAAFVEP